MVRYYVIPGFRIPYDLLFGFCWLLQQVLVGWYLACISFLSLVFVARLLSYKYPYLNLELVWPLRGLQ